MTPYRLPPEAYARLERAQNWISLGANAVGAALTYLYLGVINPLPQGSSPVFTLPFGNLLPSVLGVALLLGLGSWLGNHFSRNFPGWYRRLLNGESAAGMPEIARREVLQLPFNAALTSLAMWFLAGFFMGYLPTSQWHGFWAVFGVGGVVTSAIVYFAIDAFWREAVPHFFPQGGVNQVKALRLSVRSRLILAFAILSLYPSGLLSLTVLSRINALAGAENPAVLIQNLKLAIFFILFISLVSGAALAILVSHSIIVPLKRLQVGMAEVAENQLQVNLLVDSNDELGYLTERFNEMVTGLRRAETLRNLLNLYVSPEVARDALEHGTQLGGQLVDCSILFSDIRGFTALSEQLQPQALITLLNRYMSRMVEVVVAQGGVVNKFGGDSLLAVFGTPLNPAPDHAAAAIRTALQMQRVLKAFNAEQIQNGGPVLQIGIGIASGPAVAGNVGGEGRIEYTVIGDTVNLASRLQDLTKELGRDLLVNALAVEQATRSISLAAEPLEPVSVRGKAENVKIYAIISDF